MLRSLGGAPLSAALLALVTTLHVALLVVRRHRAPRGAARFLLSIPSTLFCIAPWVLPSAGAVGGGALAHVAWFAACERLAPRTAARPAEGAPAVSAAPRVPPPPPAPAGFFDAPVLAVLDETPDIRTFRLARPPGFAFRAGQFLTVKVDAEEGRSLARCYSISSAPEASGCLEISVKRQGRVSGLLHATLRPGALLAVRGPGGSFVHPEGDAPLLLVAAGVGITPLMSMLRHAVAAEPSRPVTLVYGVRSEADVAYRHELSALARRNPQVRLVVAVSGPAVPRGWHAGRIDRALLARALAERPGAVAMLCGPEAMLAAAHADLFALGLPEERIRSEAFTAAQAEAAAAVTPSAAARLVLVRSARTVPVPAGRTLLEAVEEAGGGIDSMCRAGSCGTCRTRLVSGAVSGCAVEEGFIHPCVSYARGDCALEA